MKVNSEITFRLCSGYSSVTGLGVTSTNFYTKIDMRIGNQSSFNSERNRSNIFQLIYKSVGRITRWYENRDKQKES